MRLALPLLLPVIVVLAIGAQSTPRTTFTVYGHGNQSCGAWTAERNSQQDFVIKSTWVLGFVSGVGWTGSTRPLRKTDVQGIDAWIDQYCSSHPLDNLSDVAIALVKDLERARTK